ncbi:hypothetical protein GJAV_G00206230 [Gymnothorax javanicus]|nr:hypothetical protein GJAV_G00206230 [Gymnothorax javanicus]
MGFLSFDFEFSGIGFPSRKLGPSVSKTQTDVMAPMCIQRWIGDPERGAAHFTRSPISFCRSSKRDGVNKRLLGALQHYSALVVV